MTRRQNKAPRLLTSPRAWIFLGLFALAWTYLFISAPEPLPDEDTEKLEDHATVYVDGMLELLQAENTAFRTLYTGQIVGPGLEQGLHFGEDWLEDGVQKGPLPALTFRAIAVRLNRGPVPLDLFLGAEKAINKGNSFQGSALKRFKTLKEDKKPQFFFDATQSMRTAMYADIATVERCVTCHNAHPKTPVTDWELGDVMGAATWMYPKERVSIEEVVEALTELRKAFKATYKSYVDRTRTFDISPEIGEKWPQDGLYLPDADVFMTEHRRRAGPETTRRLESLWQETRSEMD